jgi:hypothetical protein
MPSAHRDHAVTVPSTTLRSINADPAFASYGTPDSVSPLTTAQPDCIMQDARRNGIPPTTPTGSGQAAGKLRTEDDPSVVPLSKDGGGGIKAIDKRSLDYVLRSGLAGGVAGCAVSILNWCSCLYRETLQSPMGDDIDIKPNDVDLVTSANIKMRLTTIPGQNHCCSTGSR